MYASKGVGLAAPQVGVNKRLMVFNPGELTSPVGTSIVSCDFVVFPTSFGALVYTNCETFYKDPV